MVTGLIEVPCLINGVWTESESVQIVPDFEGIPRVRLHGANDIQVRMAKRAMLQLRRELAEVPAQLLVKVIKRSAEYYFSDTKDAELLARMSGSPIAFVLNEMELFRRWLSHIDHYLATAFGSAQYDRVPIVVGSQEVGFRKFLPTAPTVAVIPQNDDGVSSYLLAQLFLSKNPIIVKPSSRGGSAFSTMRFIQALHKAILLEAPNTPVLLRAIQLMNVLDRDDIDRAKQVANLGVDGANFVLFGADRNLATMAESISSVVSPRVVLRLGTGFSVALVLADANIPNAVEDIVRSAIEDRGNKCTTTHVLYVHEDIYELVMAELKRRAESLRAYHPLDSRACTGCIDEATRVSVEKRLCELHPRYAIAAAHATGVMSIFELDEDDSVEELPGPMLFVKRVRSAEHFCEVFERDRQRNKVQQNLCTSVYTDNPKMVDDIAACIPSHIVKWNIGTNDINLFIEHQGMFIIRELMCQRIVEHTRIRHSDVRVEEVRS